VSFTARILLLGSGELGKEFAISAKRLGAHVVACDSYAGAPAMQVADEVEIFSMLDGDRLRDAIARHKPDFVVPRWRRSAPRSSPRSRLPAPMSSRPRGRR
jgi:phosphoribosylglycinamide formyltransferase 2